MALRKVSGCWISLKSPRVVVTLKKFFSDTSNTDHSQASAENAANFLTKQTIPQVEITPELSKRKALSIDSILAAAGCEISDPLTGAISPPIYLSTTFERDNNLDLSRGYNYGRLGNPNRNQFQLAMTELESGSESLAFSSGMQSAFAVFMSCPGSHVILSDDLYHGVFVLLQEVMEKWGITYEKHDLTNLKSFRERLELLAKEGLSKKVIVWAEVPTNPTCKIPDLQKLSGILKTLMPAEHSLLVVDSTWATPFLLRPLEVGADVVLHSTTKYISGHSDCTGGSLTLGSSTSTQSILPLLRNVHQIGGGVLSPFDSWLTLRGLRTLGVRMKTHCDNAMIVAEYLQGHKAVQKVHYPGLPSHPQHKLATELFSGRYGGMLSFLVKGKEDILEDNALKVKFFFNIYKNL